MRVAAAVPREGMVEEVPTLRWALRAFDVVLSICKWLYRLRIRCRKSFVSNNSTMRYYLGGASVKRIDQYATMIKDQFSDVSIQSVESLGEGFRNYAILVNGEWVFRFPKSQQGADELNKEIQLLPLLVGHVKVSIPQFEYIGRQCNGYPFVGYRKVQGEILGEDGVNTLRDHVKDRIALQLADFLNVLKLRFIPVFLFVIQ